MTPAVSIFAGKSSLIRTHSDWKAGSYTVRRKVPAFFTVRKLALEEGHLKHFLMRLYLRMFLIILSAFRRKKNLPIRGESKITLIVLPWDCVVQYVGNDRYHAFLDLARTDLSIRLGWLPLILHQKWKPQVISCHIRHLGPLHLFDRFTVTSYIIETTSKYIWMAHRIECNGKVVCTAVSKLVAVSPRGVASLFLLPERGNFTHHFTQAAVNLLAQADAIIRNV